MPETDIIRSLPKAELHMHVEGSIEPEMLLALAARNRVTIPFATPDAVRAAYAFTDLKSFLDLYYAGLTVLVTEQDFYDVTAAYLEKAHADNVTHAEVYFSPQAHVRRGIAMETFMNGIGAAFDAASSRTGLTGGIILGIQRQFDETDALDMLEQARPFSKQVLAIGMGGPEVGNRPAKFTRAFARARDLGWRTTAHAGEEGGPDYVAECLDALNVDRIDHGVRCEGDAELVARLAALGTPLTVCPLSNVMLKVFPDLKSHNLKRLFDAGLCITINSDDPPYFGGYINDNFVQSQQALGISDADMYLIARNSFTAAFMSDQRKTECQAQLVARWTALAGVSPPAG
jgi:adenine deaminase